jgi:hypothetical protein
MVTPLVGSVLVPNGIRTKPQWPVSSMGSYCSPGWLATPVPATFDLVSEVRLYRFVRTRLGSQRGEDHIRVAPAAPVGYLGQGHDGRIVVQVRQEFARVRRDRGARISHGLAFIERITQDAGEYRACFCRPVGLQDPQKGRAAPSVASSNTVLSETPPAQRKNSWLVTVAPPADAMTPQTLWR